MIDYVAFMKNLPAVLTVTAILVLLIGVPYQIQKVFRRIENDTDSE